MTGVELRNGRYIGILEKKRKKDVVLIRPHPKIYSSAFKSRGSRAS
jgi:hypothetical protein